MFRFIYDFFFIYDFSLKHVKKKNMYMNPPLKLYIDKLS